MIEDVAAETAEQQASELTDGDRLSLGVAARLSRYLQVLTQARKMGKDTISSQELSDYTHINSTQIRRDLSGFGKFGKRGVGYNVDSLVSEIRKILRTAGQHNIALFGAGHLGQAIASSDIFADHGFRIVAMFDVDPAVIGRRGGRSPCRPRGRRSGGRGPPGQVGGEDHLQLLRAPSPGAARCHRAHLEPRR
jgi:Putative DNA-binding protein N-terminus/CoA binding domain